MGRGAPETCQRLVRFGWAAVGPGEAVLASGTNVAGTDLDGRFRWVAGFWDPPPDTPSHHSGPDRTGRSSGSIGSIRT